MYTSTMIERLQPRTLLTSIYDENGELIPPTGGAVIGVGGPHASSLVADDYGVRNNVTVIVHDDGVTITKGLGRIGNFKLPVLKKDGSVVLTGSAEADQITVERVTSNQDNIGDNEFDVVMFFDEDGRYIFSPNSFDPTINAKQKKQLEDSLAAHRSELAAAKDAGNQDRIDQRQKSVDTDQYILRRFQTMQDKLAAGRFVRYTLAGVYDCYIEVPEQLSSSAKITIDAGAGADKVTIGTSVPMKASIFGGSGADTLTSGKKAVQMFGGGGSDRLISRSTKGGTLDGGTGADRYYNRGGAELTIAARKDGDQIAVNVGTFVVSKPGVFGVQQISQISSRAYYFVAIDGAQVDLLKAS